MRYPDVPPASRTGRDRDLLPDAVPGPYETAYDTRRGYQQPLRARRSRAEPSVIRMMPREEER
jgi:hypothetical protein